MTKTLSGRLQAVADFVPDGARVADVGADHAKLTAWLMANKHASCIATDINAAPLRRARENLAGCPDARFRLGYGLTCVEPDEVDAVVVAGMGAETVADILSRSPWSRGKLCVLQPASRAYLLRRFCYERGYRISAERVVFDAGRWYSVIMTVEGEPAVLPADFCFLSAALRRSAASGGAEHSGVLSYTCKQIGFLRDVAPKMLKDTRAGRREAARFFQEALEGLELWKEGVKNEDIGTTEYH